MGGFDSTRNAESGGKALEFLSLRTDCALFAAYAVREQESTLGTASSSVKGAALPASLVRHLCPAVSSRCTARVYLHPPEPLVLTKSEKSFDFCFLLVSTDVGALCETGGNLEVGSPFLGTLFVRIIDAQRCHGGAESDIRPLRKVGHQRSRVSRSGTEDP
jgi:hypothetical protein